MSLWRPPTARSACLRWLLIGIAAMWLAGCASVLPQGERVPSKALATPADAPLARVAHTAGLTPDQSGVWPLMQADFALDARLAMIANARRSIDLQYYLIADDSTGRLILRALRDAALRGVRVRLLVDDLYTADTDRLLLGLAAHPGVEVRLFNPFVTARESSLRRFVNFLGDHKRLNHRMHNKLFIADSAVAVVGGRNLADEYFLRGKQGNFIDFDLLLAGSVVPELSQWFDLYWNSEQVYPVEVITRAAGRPSISPEESRALLDAATASDLPPNAPQSTDIFGAAPFSAGLALQSVDLIAADSTVFADSPNKIDPVNFSYATRDTLMHRFLQLLSASRNEVFLFSPYFIPGDETLVRLAKLRTEGTEVRIVTNSLAASDEPLVNIGLELHQTDLLKMGVELYELSSERLKRDRNLRRLLGNSTGRLHAKMGVLDRSTVLIGSMNLDPRSSMINTEIGVRVLSPRLAEMLLSGFKVKELAGVYQVKLKPDGSGVHWVAIDGDRTDDRDVDPDTSLWQRLQLMLLAWFVPESQL